MPARTRRAAPAATANVVSSDEPQDPSSSPSRPAMSSPQSAPLPSSSQHHAGTGLQFSEPLTWRAGRSIPVAELLRRLQALLQEMKEMDQDESDAIRGSFAKVARELADAQVLGHKDRGVRAYVACCCVEVLRLCAPDAPFTEKQLKSIFEMIIKSILPALSDPSNAYNAQHMHVLMSLAHVKSIVLLADLPSPDQLITQLFSSFFDMFSGTSKTGSGEQMAKAVSLNMTALLVTFVEEAETLPQDAVDIIVAQFLRADPRTMKGGEGNSKKGAPIDSTQSTLAMKELPPAYNVARTICNAQPERMAREVSKYFNDVIVEASGSSRDNRRDPDDDLESSFTGPSEEEMMEMEKAHRLLREIWRACPVVLENVIPQLETELSAENAQLRVLATETLGDITSGIGAAGPPPPPQMDPAAYPPITLSVPSEPSPQVNILTTPTSPQSFPRTHAHAYSSFLSRRQDKSPLVRSAWITAIGRILTTSAGGMGLTQNEESKLVEDLARMLNDSDEKVRVAATKALGTFSLKDIVNKLGASGSVDTLGSALGNLADRVKDRKHSVRVEAMTTLGRMWGVAVGEISAGNEQVKELIGGAPSKILSAFYTNDLDTQALMDRVFFEILLPLSYPPIKTKRGKQVNGNSQRVKDSQDQVNGEVEGPNLDPTTIRVERMLLLAQGLDEKAKKIFFALSSRQIALSKFMRAYIQACEDFNGGVMDQNEAATKERLSKIINEMAKFLPDPSKVSGDLWKFAKTHDRRGYQLIRFSMLVESDYRTMYNAVKEFTKRMESGSSSGLIETLLPLLYRTSNILYNKSHVPAIMEYSKTDDKGLASIAHEILTDISQRTPEVLKAQVREICLTLQEEAPTTSKPNPPGAVDTLKACAAFARKFSDEIPKDRQFGLALANFALHGKPPQAAKHAVTVIMASSNKKEMQAKDLVQKCLKDFEYGKPGFLARLAALSRLWLLAPIQVDNEADKIIDIVVKDILLKVRSPSKEASTEYKWSADIDEECEAKCWALKILVNRVRAHSTLSSLEQIAQPVYALLSTLVAEEGELSKAKDTPAAHKPRLRLVAARCFLKLSQSKKHDGLLSPQQFNKLGEVAQDGEDPVRFQFMGRLKKYLSRNTLPSRFYTIPFLLVYDPVPAFKAETITWLKSRASFFASYNPISNPGQDADKPSLSKASTVLENIFPRLISLLVHHPDYDDKPEDLLDFARYIIFYLTTISNPKNISLIYHIAQRIKANQDAIPVSQTSTTTDAPSTETPEGEAPPGYTTRLHTLADLSAHAIHALIAAHGWTLQTLPHRVSLPRSLFAEIRDHEAALAAAERDFLPEGVDAGVEALVRAVLRRGGATARHHGEARKRKSEGGEGGLSAKRARTSTGADVGTGKLAVRERKGKGAGAGRKRRSWERSDEEEDGNGSEGGGPRSKKARASVDSSERRKSGRFGSEKGRSYRERDDSEDDAELEEANDEPAENAENVGEDEDDAAKRQDHSEEHQVSDDAGSTLSDPPSDHDEEEVNDDNNVPEPSSPPAAAAESRSRSRATPSKSAAGKSSKSSKSAKTTKTPTTLSPGVAKRGGGAKTTKPASTPTPVAIAWPISSKGIANKGKAVPPAKGGARPAAKAGAGRQQGGRALRSRA